jgi:Tol biopolymer transport system component
MYRVGSTKHEAPPSADEVIPTRFDFFEPPMPQSSGSKIVFASNRDGSMQIYSMNGDGSAQTRLTNSGANDDNPRWLTNGMKILFQSDRDHPDTGSMDIYVMNSDGSGVTRLTTDASDDSAAVWSPNGSRIAFQSLQWVLLSNLCNERCRTWASESQ